jgi:hypothetical protein
MSSGNAVMATGSEISAVFCGRRRFGRMKKDSDRSNQGGGCKTMALANQRIESGHDYSPNL